MRLFLDMRQVESVQMMKARQSRKIRELRDALSAAGFHTIEEQSRALGIPRSTAWTVHKAIHKSSGLSARLINRMLASPHLPSDARAKILEYVAEKAAGHYGHLQKDCYKFISRISQDTSHPRSAGRLIFPAELINRRPTGFG